MQLDGPGSTDMNAELSQEIQNFYVEEFPMQLDGVGSTGMDAELLQEIQDFYRTYLIRPPSLF